MNRSNRIALPIAFAALLAACAPTPGTSGATPSMTSHETHSMGAMTASPAPSASATSPPASATPHDMGDMGAMETVQIEIRDFAFAPADLTIQAGTEVVVTNSDSAPHTFTAGSDDEPMPETFDSGLLDQGESFTFVFEEAGTFAFYCDRHPPMRGAITVEP